MAVNEWMNEDSQEYANVLRLNNKKHPIMATAPGEKIDCLVDEAYIYATKQGKFVVGLVPRVVFGTNMVTHPDISGEYVVNRIVGEDKKSNPHRYLISHRQLISLEDFNHIIDLNRPDLLDPQMIFQNKFNFKAVIHALVKNHWIAPKSDELVANLKEGQADQIDERIPDVVSKHAGFKRALSEWREANWINETTAKKYAITGQPVKTIDDELTFATEIRP